MDSSLSLIYDFLFIRKAEGTNVAWGSIYHDPRYIWKKNSYFSRYTHASLRKKERKFRRGWRPTIEAEHRSKYSTHVYIDRHRSASSIFPRLNAEDPACLSLSPPGEYPWKIHELDYAIPARWKNATKAML